MLPGTLSDCASISRGLRRASIAATPPGGTAPAAAADPAAMRQVRNETGWAVELCQQGLESHAVLRLRPGRSRPFHRGDATKRRRVRIRAAAADGEAAVLLADWSCAVDLDAGGSHPILVPAAGGPRPYLNFKADIVGGGGGGGGIALVKADPARAPKQGAGASSESLWPPYRHSSASGGRIPVTSRAGAVRSRPSLRPFVCARGPNAAREAAESAP